MSELARFKFERTSAGYDVNVEGICIGRKNVSGKQRHASRLPVGITRGRWQDIFGTERRRSVVCLAPNINSARYFPFEKEAPALVRGA